MANLQRKINQSTDPAPAAETLPAVVPVSASPVALGTLQASSPGALIAGAAEIAGELVQVIEKQHLVSVIQGRQYVRCEGWTTLGVMLGVVAREVQTTESEGVYTATVELVRMSDGACISRASAECGDERPWCDRPRYARRSMAQTRATGKACRLAFSWIMSLAGYEVTPAEEMPPADPAAPVATTIDAREFDALLTMIADRDLERDRVERWVSKKWGITHLSDLTSEQLDNLVPRLDRWAAEEYAKAAEADALADCPF